MASRNMAKWIGFNLGGQSITRLMQLCSVSLKLAFSQPSLWPVEPWVHNSLLARLDSGVLQALDGFQRVPAFDNMLLFGFGYESFVHMMSGSEPGVHCVILCAAFVETHSEDLAAWTLAALWETLQFPKYYQPSHNQFLALVRACAGVLVRTTFSQTARIMLGDPRDVWFPTAEDKDEYGHTFSSRGHKRAATPESMAKVLDGLFKISRREIEKMTVLGGWDCAFVAAMSDWLFNFSTEVYDTRGNLIFRSAVNEGSAQVTVRYTTGSRSTQPVDLQVTSLTYVLDDVTNLWQYEDVNDARQLIYRIRWDDCLTSTFGPSLVQRFVETKTYIGQLLGSVARIYQALANSENETLGLSRQLFVAYSESCHGKGYLLSVERIFPELAQIDGLRELMLKHCSANVIEAGKGIIAALNGLRRKCGCYASPNKVAKEDRQNMPR